MKALGSGSLASILKLVLDVVWVLSWIALSLASLVLVVSAGIFIFGYMGFDQGPTSEIFSALQTHGWKFPIFIAEIGTLMIVVHRLRRIFATLIGGDPFVPENVGHLRVIAIAIGAYQILSYATRGAVAMVLTLMDHPVEGGAHLGISADINLGAWFAVGALLVFAEVFREGARMRQEQKLTI